MLKETGVSSSALGREDLTIIADHLLTYFADDSNIIGVPASEIESSTDRVKTLATALTDVGFTNICYVPYLMEYCADLSYDRGQLDFFIAEVRKYRV